MNPGSSDRMQRPSGRSFLLDLFKSAGCILIVLHHLAFYGPMAHVAAHGWPEGMQWLAQHARLAVQVFLVCGGFLTAQSLSALPDMSMRSLGSALGRRYLRLAIPLLAALSLTVMVTDIIRPDVEHGGLSAPPDWLQAWAHVFFLQQWLDVESLSAGVWYVAVDLQLYVLAGLILWCSGSLRQRIGGKVQVWQTVLTLGLVVASLVVWTRNDWLDHTALFFWGAYGMGWLAWFTRQLPRNLWVIWGWLLLGVLCGAVDERWRALTAWGTAFVVVLQTFTGPTFASEGQPGKTSAWKRGVVWLSQISYSVFVVHFGVCLLVNFGVYHLWPNSVAMNAMGMAVALALSLLAGHALHHGVERGRPTLTRWMGWSLTFMVGMGLSIHLAV